MRHVLPRTQPTGGKHRIGIQEQRGRIATIHERLSTRCCDHQLRLSIHVMECIRTSRTHHRYSRECPTELLNRSLCPNMACTQTPATTLLTRESALDQAAPATRRRRIIRSQKLQRALTLPAAGRHSAALTSQQGDEPGACHLNQNRPGLKPSTGNLES